MLVINGENSSDFIGKSVDDFVKFKGYDLAKIAIEINGDILPKDMLDRILNDGDMVEIVHFVGGG